MEVRLVPCRTEAVLEAADGPPAPGLWRLDGGCSGEQPEAGDARRTQAGEADRLHGGGGAQGAGSGRRQGQDRRPGAARAEPEGGGRGPRSVRREPQDRPRPGPLTDQCPAPEASLRTDRELILPRRSEEHTSALQSLLRTSYAVFCLK